MAAVPSANPGLAVAVSLASAVAWHARKQLEYFEEEHGPVRELQLAQDLQASHLQLQLAQDLMAKPPTPQLAAEAYDLVREVRKRSVPSSHRCSCEDCEEALKFAALAVRELLVLVICCFAGYMMSDVRFEAALEEAFGRTLGPELRSQLHLARSAIVRLAGGLAEFERAAPKIFSSSTLSAENEKSDALFSTYQQCSRSTFVSPCSTRPKQPKQQTNAAPGLTHWMQSEALLSLTLVQIHEATQTDANVAKASLSEVVTQTEADTCDADTVNDADWVKPDNDADTLKFNETDNDAEWVMPSCIVGA